MRLFEEPCDAYNAAFRGAKSTEKSGFSTVFLGFCAEIADFGRFLWVFRG
jgi:hypothetical protein